MMTARVSAVDSVSPEGEGREIGLAGGAVGEGVGRASRAGTSSSREALPVATAARSERVKRRDGPRCKVGFLHGAGPPLPSTSVDMAFVWCLCVGAVVWVWVWWMHAKEESVMDGWEVGLGGHVGQGPRVEWGDTHTTHEPA